MNSTQENKLSIASQGQAQTNNESDFISRHIGPADNDLQAMLATLNVDSVQALIDEVVPDSIISDSPLQLDASMSEQQALAEIAELAKKNKPMKSFIGQGYYNTHVPNVILRNILENPAWYTAYTPYQPEISQGRLEAVLNYQTMVCDLTGMDLANASMLDEATAAAEAMTLGKRMAKSKSDCFFVDQQCFAQTIDVIKTRAEPLGIEVVVGDPLTDLDGLEVFAALFQYPGANGEVTDFSAAIEKVHAGRGLVVMAADILALMLLKSPGEMGADIAVGTTQRFGVPMGFGGPHAAYMATKQAFTRSMPGRIVGVSIDAQGNQVYRLALQTREQHIRREKATSNICTSQVLLAVMASMYAIYHGPARLRATAARVHHMSATLGLGLESVGYAPLNSAYFDTITLKTGSETKALHRAAREQGMNLREIDAEHLGLSVDETTSESDIELLWSIFAPANKLSFADVAAKLTDVIPSQLVREGAVLSHPVFNSYHSETEMLRYIRKLSDRDIALDRAMIPLGSCTMKLNATAEMIPVTWSEFSAIHPFAPDNQIQGYAELCDQLEEMLCAITGYDAVSLQPNAGSQGEYAGLLAIRAYHESRSEGHRNICLIPSSAHGTNPASAQMCNMKVVVVKCDDLGNVDIADLKEKAERHSDDLAAIMVTYPSTHGVFEENIRELCGIVHDHGGQVYLDGANFNAMVGLCYPGKFGGDVSHLNLHKTFCIPHGGGGPGVGPIGVKSHLAPFLPGHGRFGDVEGSTPGAVSAAPWGSASILPISWMYVRMMGRDGLKKATQAAIVNANYMATRLAEHFPILYSGKQGRVAHECIVDVRPLKTSSGISVDDIAKRLIDYGFHAPTMSFPVSGTLMIEPTESESKYEIDRFCDAMIQIRREIAAVESGEYTLEDNPLVNAPHNAEVLLSEEWAHSYSRNVAAYPMAQRNDKYWPPVGRVDNIYGDRNLMCSCPSMTDYE